MALKINPNPEIIISPSAAVPNNGKLSFGLINKAASGRAAPYPLDSGGLFVSHESQASFSDRKIFTNDIGVGGRENDP